MFGGKISRKTDGADHVMVVSIRPIVLGNMPPEGEERNYEKVAFMVQTPIKVLGDVNVGDFLIPSGMDNGLAIAVSRDRIRVDQLKQVIGVAWDDNKEIYGLVNAAVGLTTADVSSVMERQYTSLTKAEDRIQNLTAQNRTLENQVAELTSQIGQLQTSLANADARSLETLRLVEAMAARLESAESGFARLP